METHTAEPHSIGGEGWSRALRRKCAVPLRFRGLVLALCVANSAPSTAQTTTELLVDPQLTVGAGATVAAAIGEAVARAEDAFVPSRLFAERGVRRRAGNVAYRLLKFAYFDLPQEQWVMVANHEVFGHGARLRERFDGPIRYRVDAPVPYGDGGGSTSFDFDRRPTIHELLVVRAGGMEADNVAARAVANRAFVDRQMDVRTAIRYLGFELDTFGYVLGTDDESESRGHDVFNFVADYNRMAAELAARTMRPRTLRREVLASLANPMLGFAAYGIGRYLAIGDTRVAVPALSVAGVRYLPIVRYQLTAYGTEWSVTNALAAADSRSLRPGRIEIELRFGRAPLGRPWGVGVRQRHVTAWRGWQVQVGADLWRQPDVAFRREDEDDVTEASRGELGFGGEIRARAERPVVRVWFGSSPVTAIVDIGMKTAGYVPGEPLRGGLVVRAGLGLPLHR